MSNDSSQQSVMLISGEASGDNHAARLVSAMAATRPGLFLFGIGGPAMEKAGVRIFTDARALSVVGIFEVASHAGAILRGLAMARQMLAAARPDLLVLVDFPDFNLRVAKAAKKLGIPVLYYISPQIWAWRRGRVKKIQALVDHMAVILPFEKDFYQSHGVTVSCVGHPLLDDEHWAEPPPAAPAPLDAPLVGLLPGSRKSEVSRHLPVMLEAARIIRRQVPRARFALPVAPTLDINDLAALIEQQRQQSPDLPGIELLPGAIRRVLFESAAVMAASGTVTLEAALCGTPMVIIYKVSGMTFRVARRLIRVDHVGLANLIAGERVSPELLQHEATPETIAGHIIGLLDDPQRREETRRKLLAVRDLLGGPGASARAAQIAVNMLGPHG